MGHSRGWARDHRRDAKRRNAAILARRAGQPSCAQAIRSGTPRSCFDAGMDIRRLLPLTLLCLSGCALHAHAPPALVTGDFVDDYGIAYRITADEWRQLPNARYRVVRWNAEAQYLIARNDAANPSAPGLWTRIDWMPLPGMPPWEWAFCLSAYDAPTQAEAERSAIARRDTPKTGCNGYPFSRMRRAGGD